MCEGTYTCARERGNGAVGGHGQGGEGAHRTLRLSRSARQGSTRRRKRWARGGARRYAKARGAHPEERALLCPHIQSELLRLPLGGDRGCGPVTLQSPRILCHAPTPSTDGCQQLLRRHRVVNMVYTLRRHSGRRQCVSGMMKWCKPGAGAGKEKEYTNRGPSDITQRRLQQHAHGDHT